MQGILVSAICFINLQDAARNRIMDFAKNAASPLKPFVPVASEQAAAVTQSSPRSLTAANRNRIMEHAQQV